MCITAQTTLKQTEKGGRAGNRQPELWYETDNIAIRIMKRTSAEKGVRSRNEDEEQNGGPGLRQRGEGENTGQDRDPGAGQRTENRAE